MNAKILTAHARVSDRAALDRLVEPAPDSDQLREILLSGWTGKMQRYDRERRAGLYVVSDGKMAHCYTVTGIKLIQAATIAAGLDEITRRWSTAAFTGIVESVLGVSMERVQ